MHDRTARPGIVTALVILFHPVCSSAVLPFRCPRFRRSSTRCGRAPAMIGDIGTLNVRPSGLVVRAHGGGSSEQRYRNRYLAGRLRMMGWATLRTDKWVTPSSASGPVTPYWGHK